MSEIIKRLEAVGDHDWTTSHLAHTSDTALDAISEIERLRSINADMLAALEPFALRPEAVSLSKALGHITREDLQRAAIAKARGASQTGSGG